MTESLTLRQYKTLEPAEQLLHDSSLAERCSRRIEFIGCTSKSVLTVIETPAFQRQADAVWTEDEPEAFIDFIAQQPQAGDVIPGADGARKVRWHRGGSGKRGGHG